MLTVREGRGPPLDLFEQVALQGLPGSVALLGSRGSVHPSKQMVQVNGPFGFQEGLGPHNIQKSDLTSPCLGAEVTVRMDQV